MDKKRLIPYEKLSKKEKRRLDERKRAGWGGLSPVTRKVESKKHYSRKRSRDRYEDTGGSAFVAATRSAGMVERVETAEVAGVFLAELQGGKPAHALERTDEIRIVEADGLADLL